MTSHMTDEFNIIEHYFQRNIYQRSDVIIHNGDDAAIISPPPDHQIAVSTDTLISDIHFPEQTSPADIAYKALAVNLSDMAAMGAQPAWVSLSLTLPNIDHEWLNAFSQTFHDVCHLYQLELIGGDLTRGPLALTITIHGLVKKNQFLLRSNAQINDWIVVTGTLGDAGLGLAHLNQQTTINNTADAQFCVDRLNRPTPRVAQGLLIAPFAHAAIDISDGLIADLSHILEKSRCGASIYLNNISLSSAFKNNCNLKNTHHIYAFALTAGDDYELCFTVDDAGLEKINKLKKEFSIPYQVIGKIEKELGLRCYDKHRQIVNFTNKGYQHFLS